LSDLGQPDAALAYLRRGIELDTGHVGEAGQHGYTLIARIYLQQHRMKEATAILQTALDADVDTIYAKTLLEKIEHGDYDKTASDDTPAPYPTGT
jgi:tetratricopeptide (TPR) repeat protein